MLQSDRESFFELEQPLLDPTIQTPITNYLTISEDVEQIDKFITQIMVGNEQSEEVKNLIAENESSHFKFIKEITITGTPIFLINSINFAGNFVSAIMISQSSVPNILEAANFMTSIGTAATLSSISVMFSLTSMVANDYGDYLRIEAEQKRLLQYDEKFKQIQGQDYQSLVPEGLDTKQLSTRVNAKITECKQASFLQLKRTGEGLRSGWTVAAIIWIPTTLALELAVAPLLKGAGISDRVADLTQSYFRAYAIGVPAMILAAGSMQFVVGIHKGSAVLLPTLIALGINIGVGYSLIYPAGLGVSGLGYSDAMEAWISFFIYNFIFLRKDYAGSEIYKFQFNLKKIKEIFTKGSAIAFGMLVELGPIFIMSLMAGHYSSTDLAAQNVTVQYNFISYLPIITSNLIAIQSVGKYRGAKFYKNTKRIGNYVIIYSTVISSLLTLLVLGMRRQIVTAFVHEDTPDRDAVIDLSEDLLTITAVTQAIDSVRIVTTGALQGIKDVKYPFVNSFATLNCLALPLSYSLCFKLDMGAEGIAYGHGFAILVSSMSLLYRWNKKTTIPALEKGIRDEKKAQQSTKSSEVDSSSSLASSEKFSLNSLLIWGRCRRPKSAKLKETETEIPSVTTDKQDIEKPQECSWYCNIL